MEAAAVGNEIKKAFHKLKVRYLSKLCLKYFILMVG